MFHHEHVIFIMDTVVILSFEQQWIKLYCIFYRFISLVTVEINRQARTVKDKSQQKVLPNVEVYMVIFRREDYRLDMFYPLIMPTHLRTLKITLDEIWDPTYTTKWAQCIETIQV